MADPTNPARAAEPCAATGAAGLDAILRGGLAVNRLYLVEGVPGSGKTTLAMQFLMEGARLGEAVLYVTLSETDDELRAVARAHDWDIGGVQVHEMVPPEEMLHSDEQYTLFHPSEVELTEATASILAEVERLKPSRLVVDSLSEMRLLAGSPLRYRRQILALKRYFSGRNCTVLLLDDLTSTERDLQVQSIAHGVFLLDQKHADYGAGRRRLRVVKYRGVNFRGGFHDYRIRRGGLQVYPRLVAAEHRRPVGGATMSSGVESLDALLGGGIERGSSTLLIGPPGTGKSSLATQFVDKAAREGHKSAMFVFDENLHSLLRRCRSLGMDLEKHIADGLVTVQQVDPAELSPGEFVHAIREAVEVRGARMVVVDSLNGYLNAMPGEQFLVMQLHELLGYLGQSDVATVLVAAQQGLIGPQLSSPVDASYLADAVVMLRYFEAAGEVRQAISVIKKRGGSHERSIREFRLGAGGVEVGAPLRQFRGVLSGIPVFEGGVESLINPADA